MSGERKTNTIKFGISATNEVPWQFVRCEAYTIQNNNKVNKLPLIAPHWRAPNRFQSIPGGAIGSYRLVAVASTKERWISAAFQAIQGFLDEAYAPAE